MEGDPRTKEPPAGEGRRSARNGGRGTQTLRRASRLTGRNAFAPVFAAKLRREAGPMSLLVRPNGLGFHRLGVSTPKRIGNAVVRHRWKRLVREAFRRRRHTWPGSYDLVVVVRPSRRSFESHKIERLLDDALPRLHATAGQREDATASTPAETASAAAAAPRTVGQKRSKR